MKYVYLIHFVCYNQSHTEIEISIEQKSKEVLENEIRRKTHETATILYATEYEVEVKKEKKVI